MRFKSLLAALVLVASSLVASAASNNNILFSVEYEYEDDGTLIARTVNGERQTYDYDAIGQLVAVKDKNGQDVERYVL